MRLVTVSAPRGPGALFVGALVDDARIVPLRDVARARTGKDSEQFASMLTLITAGESALDAARAAVAFALSEQEPAFLLASSSAVLAAPLPNPVMLRCCSVFKGHYRNAHRTVQKWRGGREATEVTIPAAFLAIPGYYKGNHLGVVGPGATITFPPDSTHLDFELELAAIIGKPGRDVPRDRFREHVFGYTIFNDASARHPQIEEMALGTGPNKSKDFDTGNVLGPCIVTTDEFDPAVAEGIARVNGVEWGRGHAGDMAHDWGAIIEYRSRSERMHPGEVIASGCFTNCSGVEQDRFLSPGDVVELEVPGIGILRNPIDRAAS